MLFDIIVGLLIIITGISWFILINLPRHMHRVQLVPRVAVPAILSIMYLGFMATYFVTASDPFSLMFQTNALMKNEILLVSGFIHLVVFNLLVGAWISDEAYEIGAHPLLRALVLFVTSLFGPLGYLLFLVVKKRMKVSAVFV